MTIFKNPYSTGTTIKYLTLPAWLRYMSKYYTRLAVPFISKSCTVIIKCSCRLCVLPSLDTDRAVDVVQSRI